MLFYEFCKFDRRSPHGERGLKCVDDLSGGLCEEVALLMESVD